MHAMLQIHVFLDHFYFMNYKKIYDDLIKKARLENREKNDIVYYEIHHIVPNCMGGEGTKRQWKFHTNLVLLTAKEHYISHLLLCKIYPDNEKIKLAYTAMFFGLKRRGFVPSASAFSEVKNILSKNLKNKKKSKDHVTKMVNSRKANGSYKRTSESILQGKLTRQKHNNLHNPKLFGNFNASKKLLDKITCIEYKSSKDYKQEKNLTLYQFYNLLKEKKIEYI